MKNDDLTIMSFDVNNTDRGRPESKHIIKANVHEYKLLVCKLHLDTDRYSSVEDVMLVAIWWSKLLPTPANEYIRTAPAVVVFMMRNKQIWEDPDAINTVTDRTRNEEARTKCIDGNHNDTITTRIEAASEDASMLLDGHNPTLNDESRSKGSVRVDVIRDKLINASIDNAS